MKRGLLMSLAMIAVLSSILYLGVELRLTHVELDQNDDMAIEHMHFIKTVLTGHNVWADSVQDDIIENVLRDDGLTNCGIIQDLPVIYTTQSCEIQPQSLDTDLVAPNIHFCDGGNVGKDNLNDCIMIQKKLMGSLQGSILYSVSRHNVTVPFDFDIDTSFIDTLNSQLDSAFDSCTSTFNVYECIELQISLCGYDTNQICLNLGNIEKTFYVNESHFPRAMLIEEDIIKVRNPSTAFTIVQFDSPIIVTPSQVEASETFKSKILISTDYELTTLNCESSITYCDGILSIPKTEDNVYVQFNEDKYYTFKQ